MEDNLSLSIFILSFVAVIWIIYITYEPIQRWAWSDVNQKKKTHGNGSFKKMTLIKYITEIDGIVHADKSSPLSSTVTPEVLGTSKK